MTEHIMENNRVLLVGKVNSPLTYSHEMYGEGFYNFIIAVPRLSEYVDLLPITVSERLMDNIRLVVGEELVIKGQLRSYNKYTDGSNRLILTIFARELNSKDNEVKNPNQIYLNGYVCKSPVYRTTPFNREITDILVAVNRPYNKSDYIPIIAWGRNAKFSKSLPVGENIKVWGRIQSRLYEKKLSEGEVLQKVAYEVSISKMEFATDKEVKEKG